MAWMPGVPLGLVFLSWSYRQALVMNSASFHPKSPQGAGPLICMHLHTVFLK